MLPLQKPLRWLALAPCLIGCTENIRSPTADGASDAGASFPEPDAIVADIPDRVAICDQAADGTPCGDAHTQHCIFGICSDNLCGDGVVAGLEECDDSNDFDGDGCPSNCQFSPVCRDGRVDPGEECDDGNRTDTDSCSNSCTIVQCGNARVDPGEECDDGNVFSGDACSASCTNILCGNARVDPGEVCDGLSGCTGAGEACNSRCSRCEADKCGSCTKANCSDYQGINVYAGCRETPDAANGASALNDFIAKCAALDDCIRSNLSCVDASGSISCFCGAISAAECEVRDKVTGVCAAPYAAAAVCESGERQVNCVLNNYLNLTLPSGWSYYLSLCRYQMCPTECGY